jgi:hypothetical protein
MSNEENQMKSEIGKVKKSWCPMVLSAQGAFFSLFIVHCSFFIFSCAPTTNYSLLPHHPPQHNRIQGHHIEWFG